MNEKFSRRGLLKIVAGAVAGAIGANALVQKVAAKEPTAVVTGSEGQIKAIKLTQPGQVTSITGPVGGPATLTNESWILPWTATELDVLPAPSYLPWTATTYDNHLTTPSNTVGVLPNHSHAIHFPQYEDRFTILSNSDGPDYLRAYRLDDGSDDVKLAYGWTETFLVSATMGLTMEQVRERLTAHEVDLYAAMLRGEHETRIG